jgi:hypothetical protein
MKSLFILFLSWILYSACDVRFSEKDLYGTYVPFNYKNTYDSIQLNPRGVYLRKVYDKSGKKVLDMSGKWEMKDANEIQFYSFFQNLDRDISLYPELLSDTTGGVSTILRTDGTSIRFCIGHYENSNCYKRIE